MERDAEGGMMLLFKPEHVQPILEGRKTQTRRIWAKPRVLVGTVHQARLRMLDKSSTFAMLRIKRVWRVWDLRETTLEEAHAEGYSSVKEYLEAFRGINKWEGSLPTRRDADIWPVWAIEFELVTVCDVQNPSPQKRHLVLSVHPSACELEV